MNTRFLAALLAGPLAAVPTAQNPWVAGQPLPELRLPTIDRASTVDLRQFRGKKLLLVEFASW